MKKRKLKIVYKSLWATATDEQKKEYQHRIDKAYDLIFNTVMEQKINKRK